MTKHFNTAGPCLPDLHYMLPPEARLPEVRGLIDQRAFFVIHAPRQTGKTTFISQLGRALTAEGRYAAVHCSCEPGKAFDDVGLALEGVLGSLAFSARLLLPPELRPPPVQRGAAPSTMVLGALSDWAASCPRPIVLFLDEIDSLRGDALASILSQLRTGYEHRGAGFPWAVALCGLRDVRDYQAASGGDPRTVGSSSPFNVKVKSLELASFGRDDVERLYLQHTMATGQTFTPAALGRAWDLSVGQPWLANALAREVVEEIRVPSPEPIEAEHLDAAKERLILARQTHLDSLMARLQETRVRRVLEPLLSGEGVVGDSSDDDVAYVRDLGLIAPGDPVRMANPIYREVVVRALGEGTSGMIAVDPRAFIAPDGRLDLRRLLDEFAGFWVELGEMVAAGAPYQEVACQLVIMAYLQRVVNGGGYIDREYGVGRGRVDLLVRWPWTDGAGKRQWQREAFELKVWRDGRPDPLSKGLAQLDAYLDRLGLAAGVLVVFDRCSDAAPIQERTRFEEATSPSGRTITVLRA